LLVNGRFDLEVESEAVSTLNGAEGLEKAYPGEKGSAGELRFKTFISLWFDKRGILDPCWEPPPLALLEDRSLFPPIEEGSEPF
jgi:hypothetical protein